MVKTRIWIIILAAVLLVSGGAALWLNSRTAPGMTANVYQDGICIASFDLSAVTGTVRREIRCEHGVNVIEAERGRIRVAEADCPDQVCVRAGWLTDSAAPVVCLPHKLVIRLEEHAASSAPDGVSR